MPVQFIYPKGLRPEEDAAIKKVISGIQETYPDYLKTNTTVNLSDKRTGGLYGEYIKGDRVATIYNVTKADDAKIGDWQGSVKTMEADAVRQNDFRSKKGLDPVTISYGRDDLKQTIMHELFHARQDQAVTDSRYEDKFWQFQKQKQSATPTIEANADDVLRQDKNILHSTSGSYFFEGNEYTANIVPVMDQVLNGQTPKGEVANQVLSLNYQIPGWLQNVYFNNRYPEQPRPLHDATIIKNPADFDVIDSVLSAIGLTPKIHR